MYTYIYIYILYMCPRHLREYFECTYVLSTYVRQGLSQVSRTHVRTYVLSTHEITCYLRTRVHVRAIE